MSNDKSSIPNQVVDAIKEVIGEAPAQLHEPSFEGNEWIYLKECLDSTYVSSVGKFVDKFESDLALYTGAKYAITATNGTAALHIALLLAGVDSKDEVLIPTLTFVATANAVSYCNAIPHFVDSEESTLGIDTLKLRNYLEKISVQKNGNCVNKQTGNVIRALVPMHTFGHPSDLFELVALAHEYNLVLIEDAAESLGSFYKGQHTGTFGLMGVLSFNGNKTITTGGGGAILTNNEPISRRAKHIKTTAKLPHKWEFIHDEIGFNYRMPNINAALGCAQLEQLSLKLASKRKLHSLYRDAFSKVEEIELFSEPADTDSNYWLQAILISKEIAFLRDEILSETNNSGYMTRPVWGPLSELAQFKNCPSMNLDGAKDLAHRVINIPSSPNLAGRKK
jgi:aminotransferase in exopolysaccharide biosynthesis